LVEFTGETDHAHPAVDHPPTLAISSLMQRLKGRTAHERGTNSPASASAPTPVDTSAHPYFERLQ
jgi:REP element-mobilizing transposase RayT